MVTTLIVSYLGEGLLANRPATPAITAGALAAWWSTDQPAGSQLTIFDGTAWNAAGGGYSAGTPPTVVQFGSDVTGAAGVTLGVAPTNGNLLVAMTFNPATASPGAGWTAQISNSSGTDFSAVFTKTAGAGESTTQTPLGSAPGSSTGAIAMWEIHGQATSGALVGVATQVGQTNVANVPVTLPLSSGCLGLSAVAVVTTPTIVKGVNVGTQDVLSNTANRRLIAGHADFSKAAQAGIAVSLSASGQSKSSTAVISA